MEHFRVELFAPSLREGSVDEPTCWAAGSANILAELGERRGLREHKDEAFGEEVDADCDGGCNDDYFRGSFEALHAFRHGNHIVRGRLTVEYEDTWMAILAIRRTEGGCAKLLLHQWSNGISLPDCVG